jgi:RNA polymerase sigma factor (sigma-70 family)
MAVAVERMQLLGRYGGGSAAVGSLCARFATLEGELRGYLRRRTGCHADTQDLMQEIFLRLWRQPPHAEIRSLRALAFKIAQNLLSDRSRRFHIRRAAAVSLPSAIEITDSASEPDGNLEAQQTLAALLETLGGMREATRRAFWLHRIESWPHARIAAEMGISVSMVEKHISYAMSALRQSGLASVAS